MKCLMRQHTLFSLLTTALLLAGAAKSVLAQDGTYIVEPWSGRYSAVKIQPGDQKIVAAGRVQSTGGVAIARYDSIGNPDTGYGSGGLSTPLGGIARSFAGLTLQADGKAVVPATNRSGYFGAARFNTNGSLDSSFGNGGWSGVSVSPNMQVPYDVGLQSNGKIVVGGYTSNGGTVSGELAVLARFTTRGALNSGKGGFGQVIQTGRATGYTVMSFGAQLAEFKSLAVQPDDKVVAVGIFSPTGSFDGQLIVARYTADGILDTSFNSSGYSLLNLPGISYTSRWFEANGVALQSDGKIVVVSTSAGVDGSSDMLVVRYSTSGTLDTSFGGGTGYVRLDIDGIATSTYETGSGVAIQPDGRIVVVGTESLNVSGVSRNVLVARFNSNGTLDATFGAGGFKLGMPPSSPGYHSFVGAAVALMSDGHIIVAGSDDWDSTGTSAPHPLLMRFNP